MSQGLDLGNNGETTNNLANLRECIEGEREMVKEENKLWRTMIAHVMETIPH